LIAQIADVSPQWTAGVIWRIDCTNCRCQSAMDCWCNMKDWLHKLPMSVRNGLLV